MNGIKRECGYPVLIENEATAVTNQEKAEMLMVNFVKIHSSNISKDGQEGREATISENREHLQQKDDSNSLLNVPFVKAELNCALRNLITRERSNMRHYDKSSE